VKNDKAPPRRCAVYTRKSSEEGLEQDFNSLHAQREACESFTKSRQGEMLFKELLSGARRGWWRWTSGAFLALTVAALAKGAGLLAGSRMGAVARAGGGAKSEEACARAVRTVQWRMENMVRDIPRRHALACLEVC
jgi:hypothetical protein